jgi:hypothetical protein
MLIAGEPAHPVRAEVVGVVGNAYFGGRGTTTHPRYLFFSNHEQPRPPGETTFLIRHSASEDTVTRAVAKALREADPRVAIANLRSFNDQLAAEIAPLWMLTTLLMFFAGGSVLIAAIGQYAVVSFEGRRRTREFGLRIALGASPDQLIASVLSEGFRWTAAGIVLGFALSIGVGQPADPRALRRHTDGSTDVYQRVRVAERRVACRLLSPGSPRCSHGPGNRATDGVGTPTLYWRAASAAKSS